MRDQPVGLTGVPQAHVERRLAGGATIRRTDRHQGASGAVRLRRRQRSFQRQRPYSGRRWCVNPRSCLGRIRAIRRRWTWDTRRCGPPAACLRDQSVRREGGTRAASASQQSPNHVRIRLAVAAESRYNLGMTQYEAVVTTGIYCRPGCPAKALPGNVRRYECAVAAEAAGYRACLRLSVVYRVGAAGVGCS